jgi:hypothetical protein
VIQMELPLAMVVELSGAQRDDRGMFHLTALPGAIAQNAIPLLPLRLGKYELGTYRLVGLEATYNRNGTRLLATLEQVR